MFTLTNSLEGTWDLIWEDTFTGSKIDETKWNFINDGGGFGNNELQHYTSRQTNARLENNTLIIEAHNEPYKGNKYTSTKMTTKDKAFWKYGRFVIRARLPEGQGIWPAIWMMPKDMECYSGWPACGEIDIMELIGHEPDTVYGTLHYGLPHTYTGEKYILPNGKKFSEDFHEFSIEWEPNAIRWYVDGIHYATQTNWFSKQMKDGGQEPYPAPFDREFYLQLNLAVGGKWPGYPTESTVFPQRMEVDFVRVYQKKS